MRTVAGEKLHWAVDGVGNDIVARLAGIAAAVAVAAAADDTDSGSTAAVAAGSVAADADGKKID